MPIPLLGPFPKHPAELSAYQQNLLEQIEQALVLHPHLLITLARRPQKTENIGTVLACIDRILSYTPVSRILMIAAPKSEMVQAYQTWISCERVETNSFVEFLN